MLKLGRQPDTKTIAKPCVYCGDIMMCSKQQLGVKKFCSSKCERTSKVKPYPRNQKRSYTIVIRKCKTCNADMNCNQWQKTKLFCSEDCKRENSKKI